MSALRYCPVCGELHDNAAALLAHVGGAECLAKLQAGPPWETWRLFDGPREIDPVATLEAATRLRELLGISIQERQCVGPIGAHPIDALPLVLSTPVIEA